MSDIPIIFSTPMIRALLDGRKTMTRRLAWRENGKPSTWQKVKPGDRLWVRESFFLADAYLEAKRFTGGAYKADETHPMALKYTGWRPSIHMPRWASRLTLTVTATKIEPLLDISEEDAIQEGFQAGKIDDGFGPRDIGGGWTIECPGGWASAAGHFQILWTKLHPEWDGYSSPEVVALTFTVAQRNIDAEAKAA